MIEAEGKTVTINSATIIPQLKFRNSNSLFRLSSFSIFAFKIYEKIF